MTKKPEEEWDESWLTEQDDEPVPVVEDRADSGTDWTALEVEEIKLEGTTLVEVDDNEIPGALNFLDDPMEELFSPPKVTTSPKMPLPVAWKTTATLPEFDGIEVELIFDPTREHSLLEVTTPSHRSVIHSTVLFLGTSLTCTFRVAEGVTNRVVLGREDLRGRFLIDCSLPVA